MDRRETKNRKNFDGLLAAWLAKLDTEELNKQFLSKAVRVVRMGKKRSNVPDRRNTESLEPEEHVIRLITRLLFIWFIKEKGIGGRCVIQQIANPRPTGRRRF